MSNINLDLKDESNDFLLIIKQLNQSNGQKRIEVLERAIEMVDSLEKSNMLLACCLEQEKHKVSLACNQIW